MKDRILRMLRERPGEYVSGEELAGGDVTRAAIWKAVKALRDEGYNIEASTRRGYRLAGVPDLLLPEEVRNGLKSGLFGRTILHFRKVDSTNRVAKELARQGAEEGALVLTEEQAKGRGRLGRRWHSPAGMSIAMSLVLRPEIPLSGISLITSVAALGAAYGIEEAAGIRPGIKWPNDLFVSGRKLCGILLEVGGEMDRVDYVVVGIGVNVNTRIDHLPEELREIATSLRIECGKEVSRVKLVQSILKHFEAYYRLLCAGQGEAIIEEIKSRSCTLGRHVKVTGIKGVVEGLAVDIAKDGALILKDDEGRLQQIYSGDVEASLGN